MKSWLVASWFLLLNLDSWIGFLMLDLEVLNQLLGLLASSKLFGSSSWSLLLQNAPTLGKCNNNATSSKVIVTPPTGKWKLLVSLCQRSTKADISPQSPVSKEHAIKGLSPLVATRHSISRAGLTNLAIIIPWEDNFQLQMLLQTIISIV